uniref:Uncharacterized protein n=1 Tax=Lotharella globosa TaxID=91324 RepID=A0A7S3Z7B9_9EUKA
MHDVSLSRVGHLDPAPKSLKNKPAVLGNPRRTLRHPATSNKVSSEEATPQTSSEKHNCWAILSTLHPCPICNIFPSPYVTFMKLLAEPMSGSLVHPEPPLKSRNSPDLR